MRKKKGGRKDGRALRIEGRKRTEEGKGEESRKGKGRRMEARKKGRKEERERRKE